MKQASSRIVPGFAFGVLLFSLAISMRCFGGGVEFTDPTTVLPLSPSNDGKVSAKIAIRNDGSAVEIAFSTLLQDLERKPSNVAVTIIGDSKVKHGANLVEIELVTSTRDLPLTGHLVLTTLGSDTTTVKHRPLRLNTPLLSCTLHVVIWSALVVSLGLVGFCWWRAKCADPDLTLRDPMGPTNWDFGKSWASNITAAGAVLATAAVLAVLPEQTVYLNRQTYTALNLLFMGLIAVAPVIFNSIRKAVLPPKATGVEYQGFVGMFLVSCVLTIWAVIGQLETIVLLLGELEVAGLFFSLAVYVFQGLVLLVLAALIAYSSMTMYWTVLNPKVQAAARERAATQERQATAKTAPATAEAVPAPASVPEALPAWHVL